MKELDSFTVERLEEIRNSFLDRIQETAPSIEEVFALIDIALAAKRAEPINLESAIEKFKEYNIGFPVEKLKADFVISWCLNNLTPQLNSPEIPEDWKLVPIIAYPSQWAAGQKAHNNAGINKVDAVYKAMVAAAPNTSGFDPSLPGAEATVITHYHTPDGYKLVPTEITKAMRDAWDSAPNGHEDDDVNMCNAYRAMIAAAPEKPL
ncbi:hypothetical protein [Yersinia enterocolitica]|uniref:hypothetical protein n=1 Tax=Yersinia enterocolitica TaxID=630 RepID=UPI003F48EEE2